MAKKEKESSMMFKKPKDVSYTQMAM